MAAMAQAGQGDLFARRDRIQRDFEAFHAKNPHVYVELVRLADQWLSRGRKHIGIAMLFEVLRWQIAMQTEGDEFKLNNNFRSRYARKLMLDFPRFRGLFEIRELSSGSAPWEE